MVCVIYGLCLGDWVCLEIDITRLPGGVSSVVYEAPAPVGDKESYHSKEDAKEDAGPLFPHIYGGISAASVVKKYNIIRAADGSFTSIDFTTEAII